MCSSDLPAYAGITAKYRGHRTRQNCGFFMPEIRARSATHRRGTESGKRPFSRTRIGVLRSTPGTKAGFHPRTNNRGRRYAVVAAWKRHPYSLPLVASPGIDSFQFGATTMTTLKPSTLVYLGQIQAERSSIRQSIPVESIAWHFVGIAHQAVTCALKEIVRAGGGK